jgi:hypothetical protein
MNKSRILGAFMLALFLVAPTAFAQTASATASSTASTTITSAMLQPVLTALGGVLSTLSYRISTQGVNSIPNRPAVAQILGNIGNLLAVFSAQLSGTTATVGGTTGTTAGAANTDAPAFPNTGDGPEGIHGWEIFAAAAFFAGTGLLVKSFRAR